MHSIVIPYTKSEPRNHKSLQTQSWLMNPKAFKCLARWQISRLQRPYEALHSQKEDSQQRHSSVHRQKTAWSCRGCPFSPSEQWSAWFSRRWWNRSPTKIHPTQHQKCTHYTTNSHHQELLCRAIKSTHNLTRTIIRLSFFSFLNKRDRPRTFLSISRMFSLDNMKHFSWQKQNNGEHRAMGNWSGKTSPNTLQSLRDINLSFKNGRNKTGIHENQSTV